MGHLSEWLAWEIFKIPPGMISDATESESLAYAKAILVCAAGDGEISPEERQWLLGYLETQGDPASIIDAMRTYDGGDSLEELVNSSPMMSITGRALVYDALRACASDGDLSAQERARIVSMAGTLKIGPDVVEELEDIVRQESQLRDRRHQLIIVPVAGGA